MIIFRVINQYIWSYCFKETLLYKDLKTENSELAKVKIATAISPFELSKIDLATTSIKYFAERGGSENIVYLKIYFNINIELLDE